MPLDGDIKNFVKTDSEVVTVLKKARALIDRPEKWCKNALYRGDARCLRGAIWDASGESYPVASRAERALGFKSGRGERWDVCLPAWNNAEERTHAEIMAALDRAIILAGGEP